MKLTEDRRKLWIWLCVNGGKWTAKELAQRYGGDSEDIFRTLHAMSRRELIAQFPPEAGQYRKRYGVTGTCLVPMGVRVGEAQA